ncbi:hypothetical protein SAMN02799624_00795 [Paenibacillus sp. UNC496MF]|uniref:glucuronyl esterase domain-containing protein n=1 Tax=Paenibacillus sp. UNC496MF TaxID=1502753 RepID=UPI0008E60BCB|nr:acetylxylan esterase [Paenibacillus sp. UNC496MF]SFI39514.1 hypothetical protein SAMN02799624_00795 [Paenibacillus sp. UNC496MF]
MNGTATRKRIELSFDGPGGTIVIRLLLFVPSTGEPRKAPAFLFLCNRERAHMDPDRRERSGFWPAEDLVARGYAAAVFHVEDADPDYDDGFRNGAHGAFDPPGPRADDAWGAIAAWAWGASRAMDYLETDPGIDASRIALVGHSRGGKAALWGGAQDERFALVASNNSGSTGAAIARGKAGETIADINRQFPHWFCERYKRYNGKEDDLPVDQHQLLALIAPRPLYVASATEDEWADPEAEFMACVLASPAYGLLGRQGVSAELRPAPDTPLTGGGIGYHLRTGGHDLTRYDWQRFMDYADLHMRG